MSMRVAWCTAAREVASFTRSGEPLPAEWYAGGCVNTEATRPRMATDRDAGVDLAARQR